MSSSMNQNLKTKTQSKIADLEKSIALSQMELKTLKLELDKINLEIEKQKAEKELEKVKKESEKKIEKIKKEGEKNIEKAKKEIIKEITYEIKDKVCPAFVYLFELGSTIDLCSSFEVPKEKIASGWSIYKFGRTDNLKSRESDHKKDYERFSKVKIKLVHSVECSNKDVSSNETKIKKWFKENSYDFVTKTLVCGEGESKIKKCNELVIIQTKDLKKVKDLYGTL
jgi:hypothetical protein